MSKAGEHQPVVNGSQVMAAGLASTLAAFVTSRFGVAGTLIGAGLTAMIITGGSAVLKAYLENVTGAVRKAPEKLRSRRQRRQAGRHTEPAYSEPTSALPTRPDLRDNFVGRMRAAFGWFSHLPLYSRRSIMRKALLGSAAAFVIGLGLVFFVEKGIGNSLSCGLWAECPTGAQPGIHLGETRGTGAGSSVTFGRPATDDAAPVGEDPATGQPGAEPTPEEPGVPAEPETPVEEPAPEEPVEPAPVEPPVEEQPGAVAPSGNSAAEPLPSE